VGRRFPVPPQDLAISDSVIIFVHEGTEGNLWVGGVLVVWYAVLTVAQQYLTHSDFFRLYLFPLSLVARPIAGASNKSGFTTLNGAGRPCCEDDQPMTAGPFAMQCSNIRKMNLSPFTSNYFSLGTSVCPSARSPWLYLISLLCVLWHGTDSSSPRQRSGRRTYPQLPRRTSPEWT
jgi:hypothetical protein